MKRLGDRNIESLVANFDKFLCRHGDIASNLS
jgi:hypothetical protein